MIQNIKSNFPIFTNNPDLIYLDSAATSQRPKQVIKAITKFYEKENANIHRGIYSLSEEATQKYNQARKTTANFINSNENEIIFTKNTTESINLIANTIQPLIKKGKDEILLTEMEHHSNLVPWQQLARKHNFKLKSIPITENYELDYEKAKELINEKTALVSFTYISNVFGTINNAKQLINLAKEKGAITIIDAAQSPSHIKIDVKDLDTDFLAFSAHKLYGPLGIGILYGKKQLLDQLAPFQFGGGMINKVTYEDSTFIETPEKFEAGTQNIPGAIGLAKAINFIQEIGLENIKDHENELTNYTLNKLKEIENLTLYSPSPEKNAGVISFTLKNIHPHDIAEILNDNNIAIRAGHHCCMPLMNLLNIPGTCRISLAIFNTKEDIDKLIEALKKVQEVFR